MQELINLFGRSLSELKNERKPISTGLVVLDNLLGGGLINKGVNIITGAPGVGKTELLLKISENAYNSGYDILYLDTELSILETRLEYINKDLANYIIPSALTLEELDEQINKLNTYLAKQKKPLLFVIDSITALTTTKKIDQSIEKESAIGIEAKLLTNIVHKLLKMVSVYNLTVICSAHLKQAIQMNPMMSNAYQITYKGYRIPGGQALQYIASQMLILTHKGKKELKDLTLNFIEVYVLKNRLAPSGLNTTLVYIPGSGYNNLLSSIKYLEDNELITVNQGRFKLPFIDKSMLLKDIVIEYKTNKEFAKKMDEYIIKHINVKLENMLNQNIKEDEIVEELNSNNNVKMNDINTNQIDAVKDDDLLTI